MIMIELLLVEAKVQQHLFVLSLLQLSSQVYQFKKKQI